jgi:ferredoxin
MLFSCLVRCNLIRRNVPAQEELLDLAARGTREVRHHVHLLRPLLPGQPRLLQAGPDLDEGGRRVPGPQSQDGRGVLAEPGVRCGHDRRLQGVLLAHGADPGQIFAERFEQAPGGPAGPAQEGTVSIVLSRTRRTVAQHAGETLLESARRAGLAPPFSCEAGNCATCMARVTEGEAKMRVNNALDEDEVADGWILTCQGEPVTPHVTVVYEN